MNLGAVLLAVAAISAIAALALFRYLSRRHVAPLLRAMIDRGVREGKAIDGILREAAAKLRRRPPYSLVKEEEMNFFLDVLQDLAAPVDVAARIWQRFELRYNLSSFRERPALLQMAYLEDLEIGMRALIETATRLQKNAGDQYPNIGIALLGAISRREGWSFTEEQPDAVAFRYSGNDVRIAKQSSGKEVARIVLFEELKQRPILAPDRASYEARQSGRKAFLEDFDARFEAVFREIARA